MTLTRVPDRDYFHVDCDLPAWAAQILRSRPERFSVRNEVNSCLAAVGYLHEAGRGARYHVGRAIGEDLAIAVENLGAYTPVPGGAHQQLSISLDKNAARTLSRLAKRFPAPDPQAAEVAAMSWALQMGSEVLRALEEGRPVSLITRRGKAVHLGPESFRSRGSQPPTPQQLALANPMLPVADGDRELARQKLEGDVGAGRLDLPGYEARVGQVWKARTSGDLSAATDLSRSVPPESLLPSTGSRATGTDRLRQRLHLAPRR